MDWCELLHLKKTRAQKILHKLFQILLMLSILLLIPQVVVNVKLTEMNGSLRTQSKHSHSECKLRQQWDEPRLYLPVNVYSESGIQTVPPTLCVPNASLLLQVPPGPPAVQAQSL